MHDKKAKETEKSQIQIDGKESAFKEMRRGLDLP